MTQIQSPLTSTDDSTLSDNENEQIEENEETQRDVRKEMKDYWQFHCQDNPTRDTMMLMNNAQDIDSAERMEILGLLPKYENKKILELGCGIGRFTGTLAKRGKHVTAVDFIKSCIEKNQETNKNLKNIKYLCEDVTKSNFKESLFSIVFSNWLMMYLDTKETKKLAKNMVKWCKPKGFIFFRESCTGGASGDKPRLSNPTFYRQHLFYTSLFSNFDELELLTVSRVRCYQEMKNKTNQYVWLFQKK